MFFPPTLFFGIWSWIEGYDLWLGRGWMLYVITAFIFFSWLANVCSLKALKLAPNPGYSLIISKSYVVLSSLLAIPLLGSPFTWIDAIAIVCIIGFAALILIDPKIHHKNNGFQRIYFSLFAFVGRALLAISITYFLQQDFAVVPIIFRVFLVTTICIGVDISLKRKEVLYRYVPWYLITGITIGMILLNRGMITGYTLAPNPGYLNAANVSSVAFISLFSSRIFKDELSLRKMIGIVGVVVGISILFVF